MDMNQGHDGTMTIVGSAYLCLELRHLISIERIARIVRSDILHPDLSKRVPVSNVAVLARKGSASGHALGFKLVVEQLHSLL